MTLRSVANLEKEIADLEKQYVGEPEVVEAVTEEVLEPVVAPPDKQTSDEDKSWAKRYADLRKLQQKTAERVKELEKAQPTTSAVTEEQVKDWINTNPKAADIIKAIVVKTAPVDDISEIRSEIAQTKALSAIMKAHPDFEEITESDAFHEWADKQPERMQALVFSDQASDVIWALNLYKEVSKPTADPKKEAARLVKTKTGNENPSDKSTQVYSESAVQRMSLSDYEKNEAAIMAAQRSGNFVYDLSGGAR